MFGDVKVTKKLLTQLVISSSQSCLEHRHHIQKLWHIDMKLACTCSNDVGSNW